MAKKPHHQCTAAGLAKHNNEEVLAALNEDADVAEWAPEFKEACANARKPWPALEREWAKQGVTVEVDEYGLYAYRSADGTTLYSCNLNAPAKPGRPTAIVPAFNKSGDPSLFAGFKRSKVRDLTPAGLEALAEELWPLDLDEGQPERISALRYAVRFGATVYVFTAMECRPWRPDEIAAQEAKAKREQEEWEARYFKEFGVKFDPSDAFEPIPEEEHPRLPLASATVMVTDYDQWAGTLYLEAEQEQFDVFA